MDWGGRAVVKPMDAVKMPSSAEACGFLVVEISVFFVVELWGAPAAWRGVRFETGRLRIVAGLGSIDLGAVVRFGTVPVVARCRSDARNAAASATSETVGSASKASGSPGLRPTRPPRMRRPRRWAGRGPWCTNPMQARRRQRAADADDPDVPRRQFGGQHPTEGFLPRRWAACPGCRRWPAATRLREREDHIGRCLSMCRATACW